MRETLRNVGVSKRRVVPKAYPIRYIPEFAPGEKTIISTPLINTPTEPKVSRVRTFPRKQPPLRKAYPRRPTPVIFPVVKPERPMRRAA